MVTSDLLVEACASTGGAGLQRPALDTANLMTFEVLIPAAAPVFDLWIDDVAFYR